MSTNTTVAHSWIKFLPFAVILLAVALTLSLIFANLQPGVRFGSPASGSESSIQRGMEADAARYTAMAEYFAAKEAAGIPVDHTADAARYNAMAEYFAAKDIASIEHSRAADAARYSAMAEAYSAQNAATQRWIEAYAARCNAMAEAYAGK